MSIWSVIIKIPWTEGWKICTCSNHTVHSYKSFRKVPLDFWLSVQSYHKTHDALHLFSDSPKLNFEIWKKNTVREKLDKERKKLRYDNRKRVSSEKKKEGKATSRLASFVCFVNWLFIPFSPNFLGYLKNLSKIELSLAKVHHGMSWLGNKRIDETT